jgi:hypothetical protein
VLYYITYKKLKQKGKKKMKVKEFLDCIDLESITGQGITIIIPIKEKLVNGDIQGHGQYIEQCSLAENEKVVFNSDEYSIWDVEKYENFGIEPCFITDVEDDPDYNTIDVRTSLDGYDYILSEYGEIWVVVY